MKLQRLIKSSLLDIEAIRGQHPELFEPFSNWEELRPSFEVRDFEDCKLLLAYIEEEDFEALADIFQGKEGAMGAFLSLAMEHGWEEVPEGYCVYHAQQEGNKLIAGLKVGERIELYEQRTVEQLVQNMATYPRIVVYSSEVLTYVKDIYPEIDRKAYIIAREIAKRTGRVPELSELSKLYGIPLDDLEGKLRLIERLLENPVILPHGEVSLPPYSLPVRGCED